MQNSIKKWHIIFIIITLVVIAVFTSFYYHYKIVSEVVTLSDNIEKSSPIRESNNSKSSSTNNSNLSSIHNNFLKALTSHSSSQDFTPNYGVDSYSNYLMNVNLLITKFLRNRNYDEQLKVIRNVSLPKDIEEILQNFNEYNKYLLANNDDMEIIFPRLHPKLQKFFTIEKKSSISIEKEKYHYKIVNKLEYLINFFYSKEFRQEFIK